MTTDTTQQNNGGGAQGDKTQQDGQQQGSSMLDVEKIKAGAKGEGETQQGTQDKTTTAGADGKNPPGTTSEPGEKPTRPEYLPEKFWDPEKGEPRLEAMNKAYSDLEKQFRAGDHKAPAKAADYKVALSDEHKTLLFGAKDADAHKDPLFQKFSGWGEKYKVSQAAFDELLGMYAEASGEEAGKFQIDVAAERKALGKNADAVIQNQHSFFESLYKQGVIGEAELKEAGILFETAAGIKLVQAIRAHYGEQSIPVDTPLESLDGVPSGEELGKMVVDAKYGVDKDFTAKVDGWYKKRYGTAPAMSSVATR